MLKEIRFRPYLREDIPFIQNSWGRSYYNAVPKHRVLTPEVFHTYHRPKREKFFANPTAAVIIASPEKNDLILGYVAVEKPPIEDCIIIHYLYVKEVFRGEGIGLELLRKVSNGTVFFTHLTPSGRAILRTHPTLMSYSPHLI